MSDRFNRTRIARVSMIAIVAAGILARLRGIDISFWMDEAWVSNSLLGATAHEIFYYPAWLQTSPPGFLVLSRLAVEIVGLSHVGLRVVPVASAIVGLLIVALIARRLLRPAYALLPVAVLAFSPTAVTYGRMMKQYSTELAVGALMLLVAWRYVKEPDRRRYAALLVILAAGLTCAYGAAFVAGGVLLLLTPGLLSGVTSTRESAGRWLGACVVVAGTLVVEYVVFYLPNSSPELHRFWGIISINRPNESVLQQVFRNLVILVRHAALPASTVSGGLIAGGALIGAGLIYACRFDRPTALVIASVTAAPIVALMIAGMGGVYPNSTRTSLVLLPGLAVLAGYGLQASAHWARRSGPAWLAGTITGVTLGATAVIVVNGAMAQASAPEPLEDYQKAVAYMRDGAKSGDLVFVHACCEEGFKLYRRLEPWTTPVRVAVGRTGHACCPRGIEVVKADNQSVRADVLRHLPHAFRGRVFLFSTDRIDYWRYSSVAPEGPMLMEALQQVGCRAVEQNRFINMRVDVLDCNTPSRPAGAVLQIFESGLAPAQEHLTDAGEVVTRDRAR